MSDWFQAILALCAVAITVVVVPLLVRLRRTAERAEALLGVVERELSPLMAELHGLADALRDTIRDVQQELKRVGAIADHVENVASGIARTVNALAALTKAGQVVALVAGLRKGVDVFVQRFRSGEVHGPPGVKR